MREENAALYKMVEDDGAERGEEHKSLKRLRS
jgi:hypothetical protein